MKTMLWIITAVVLGLLVQRAEATCNVSTGEGCYSGYPIAEECMASDMWSWNCDKCPKPAPEGYCPKPKNAFGGDIAVLYPFSPADMQSFYNDAATGLDRALIHWEACVAHRRIEQENYGLVNPIVGN